VTTGAASSRVSVTSGSAGIRSTVTALGAVVMDGWRWTPAGGWEAGPAFFALPLQLHLA
jgi:hypothetical protein